MGRLSNADFAAEMRKLLLSSMKMGYNLSFDLDKIGIDFSTESPFYSQEFWPSDVIFDF